MAKDLQGKSLSFDTPDLANLSGWVADSITISPPTVKNYTFVKYDYTQNFNGTFTYPRITENTPTPVITLVYGKNLTVTFDSAGGSAVGNISVVESQKIKAPSAPTHKGYTFSGWYLGERTTAWDFSTNTVSDNMTLVAK